MSDSAREFGYKAGMNAIAAVRRGFTGKQIMSLLGVVPLGAYVVAHLCTNLYSLAGADAFDAALKASRAHPAFVALEIFGLGLPILVHAWIGLTIIFKMRPNTMQYPTLRNLKYLLQRLSGLGVLLFLGAHVVKARLLPAMEGTTETWWGMHEALSEPVTLSVYVLGMLGISFHLANGVWGSAITFGLTVTPRAQARSQWVSALFFVALLVMSGLSIYGFKPFE
jgi:succinate dehydrogenase / fumarate reductase cytochrome b subunit